MGHTPAFSTAGGDEAGIFFKVDTKVIQVGVDSYLLLLRQCIHINPIRAGIVEKSEAYSYSIYKSFISRKGRKS